MRRRAVAGPMRRDLQPYYALAGLAALVAVLLVVPGTRAWLLDVWAPVRAQAEGRSLGGYTLASMVAWAAVGLVLAWVAYDLAFVRLRYQTDRAFFLALAPFLVVGPLFHALLAVGALPRGSALAYLAAEPPVYLTTGALVMLALAVGRATRRPLAAPLVVGALALLPLVVLAAQRMDASTLGRLGVVLLLALVPTALAAYALRKREDPGAVAAVVGAHGLDGATTWMVLRDPFGLGFGTFGEKNPVSQRLVGVSNGWPYYAVKLALPLVILLLVKDDRNDPRTRAFLLFAVFVLGYGPGASNLLQVLLA